MTRSSRHKSYRTHKHSSRDLKDRSESEDDRDSRDRKKSGEERETRVSRDFEPEKRKYSQGKDRVGIDDDDFSVDHGKKRKDKAEDSAATDRWNGGGDDDGMVDKCSKGERFGAVDSRKSANTKLLAVDSKGKSSTRMDSSSERYEENGGREESVKWRSEKDLSRRESSSSSRYRDEKERERERGLERDKKNVQDSRHERIDDVAKKDNTELQIQDDIRNPELEIELEKRMKRRSGGSGDNDKSQLDSRDSDDRRLSSRDDRTKNASYKDERHKDERHKGERYRDKYREDLDRDQRHRDDRHRDEHSSSDYNNNRSDKKHYRDEKRLSESRFKKSKLHDSDRDGSPYLEDHETKFKDTRVWKRSFDENDDHSDLKLRSSKEAHRDVEKRSSNTSKLDFVHQDKVDSSISNSRPKSSASSSAHTGKDQSRLSLKQTEPAGGEPLSEERFHPSAASTGDRARVSGVRGRFSECQSLEKKKVKNSIKSGELLIETAACSQYDRTPRSEGHISPIQSTEKSPSSTSDRWFSNRSGVRHSVDIEDMGKSNISNHGRESSTVDERVSEFPLENPTLGNHSEADLQNSKLIPVGSTIHFSGSSPGHLSLPLPVRLGNASPSVLGLYEDDSRVKIGDRRFSSRYKRNGDLNMERGQGSAWKSALAWPTSVATGFIPFHQGPPPPGFHLAIEQFPAPSLFGMRPLMDMNHTGFSYQVHEMADRFSGHGHPFGGWRNPVDDSYSPQLQGWDGSNGVIGDESHVNGKPDWDQNRHLKGSQGWKMNAVMWKGQCGSMNMEFSVPQKESEYSTCAMADEVRVGQSGQRSSSERAQSDRAPSTEMKRTNNPTERDSIGTSSKTIPEKTPKPCKLPNNSSAQFFCNYLSKLDISLDLARPELYEQCMTLLATTDSHGVCNVPKQGDTQNSKEDPKVAVKSPNVNLLFPITANAIFQRAMSLYKKQDKTKVKFPAFPFCSEEETDSPEASEREKAKAVDDQAPEDPSVANDTSCNIEEEGSNTMTDAEGDIPGDTQEKRSDLISDVFVEDSQACEPLGSECRVNLSQIHNYPESTH